MSICHVSNYFEAFRLYASSSLDYVDCYLCAMKKKYTIATFDKKLNKCINQ
jgi:predicted nucleic acid-binding protein